MEAPSSTAGNEMAQQHPGDQSAATQGLGGLFTAPDPQHTSDSNTGDAQTCVNYFQHQATGYPTTLQWQPPLTVSTQPTVNQQLNAPGSRKKARKAPNTATGRVSKARMNTTRLNEDARPPMGVDITAKEIAIFNQKWMVSPDLARRFQRNGITGPMISTTHLEAIGRANNAKDQTTLKNKTKKEYSQGGMYALKCKKWKVSKATAMGPENVLTANGWKFRDYYRHRNGDTKDAPKQGWNDYPLSLFYSHIPTDKWPTGQDRGIMTRVFEFCKKHGRTEATTADWNAIIEEMPAEPKVVPLNRSKNFDQEAAEAFSSRKQAASSQDDS
ncbi:hypothetical protein CKM354_000023500 [Cercospora kikuchii]|uniref:Uncharacterized protein n=1 Tax=Cercospora kikuchii TaxID=84275 RepID=A0A9P3F7K9_9PEZI|nr:uncharacterized protein CKM354_000023500 [Cercospora kikuchii]GIZ36768.1 hypothetical protein CKM354_000023500 [Cercospora kikuchii]